MRRLKNLGYAGIIAVGLLAMSAVSYAAPEAVESAGAPVDPISQELHAALGSAIVTIAIFVSLFIVLRLTAWKPILQGLQTREMAIRESIEAAAKAREEADKTTRELEAKIAEAQKAGQQQLMQAKADAQKLAEGIRAAAETEAGALRERALRDIEGAKQQALAEINSHGAELGTAIAEKILRRSVTVEDQGRLVEESLAEMARKN